MMARWGRNLLPQSLYAQILLVVALALFVAQIVNATILFSGIRSRNMLEAATQLTGRVNNYADRQLDRAQTRSGTERRQNQNAKPKRKRLPGISVVESSGPLIIPSFEKHPEFSARANEYLDQNAIGVGNAVFSSGAFALLPPELQKGPLQRPGIVRLRAMGRDMPRETLLVSVQTADGRWLNAATLLRPRDTRTVIAMLLQTLLIYVAVMIPLALVARRIAKPLSRLTARVDQVGRDGDVAPLQNEGPSDVRQLIMAFNAMQSRVASLLSEKDVMLGAIGHDLKTPLASLRVRVESVTDDQERGKMAATIDEMATILDDILMLARLGKSGEANQRTDIGALVESVTEEFANAGAKIEFTAPEQRVVAGIRPVLIRRALRNVIGNALEYGASAKITVQQTGDTLAIIIDDNGPGIAADKIEQMFEPFVRAEGSRNRETGGSGLGLTIARAILRSHSGDIRLENRAEGGLRVWVELPT
jgi:signal transduction histidine kinase